MSILRRRTHTGIVEVRLATDGGYFWRLRANNGETLCHSETYTRRGDAERGARAARKAFERARWVK